MVSDTELLKRAVQEHNAILIYGAGGHGRVVKDFFSPPDFVLFVDDDKDKLGAFNSKEIPFGAQVVIAVGDNAAREDVSVKLRNSGKHLIFPTVSHPSAIISRRSSFGMGSMLCAGSISIAGTVAGTFCIINTSATVDHDCKLGDFVHIAPGVNLCGNVHVGDRTLVGVGSVVRPDITIGSDTIIGAGSVVVSDIPSGVVAYGNPCQVRREIT